MICIGIPDFVFLVFLFKRIVCVCVCVYERERERERERKEHNTYLGRSRLEGKSSLKSYKPGSNPSFPAV